MTDFDYIGLGCHSSGCAPTLNMAKLSTEPYLVSNLSNKLNQCIHVDDVCDGIIDCPGAEDGSIEVTEISGGNGNYTYSINGIEFQVSNVFVDLAPSEYQVFGPWAFYFNIKFLLKK